MMSELRWDQNVEVTGSIPQSTSRKQRAGDAGIVGGAGLWLQKGKGSLVQYLQLYAEQDPETEGCARVLVGCF